jgi:hypothetical protein
MNTLRSSFNGGEISELMDSRVDSEKYPFSCRRLRNFIPRIYGGAFRRPGMMFLGTVGDDDSAVLLLPFNVSAEVRYILEFGANYLRIWNSDGTRVMNGASPLSLSSLYSSADLPDVKFVQLNNVAFFVHPDYLPRQLTRSYDAAGGGFLFSLQPVDFSEPAFRSTNQTAATVTPAATTGTTTLSFSANVFDEALSLDDYVGSRISITQQRAAASVALALTSTADSSTMQILGEYTLATYGTWSGTLRVEAQDGAGAWQTIRSYAGAADRNILQISEFQTPQTVRLSYTATNAGTGSPRAVLEVADSSQRGVAQIVEVNLVSDLPVVDVVILEALHSTAATTDWALEAFAEYSGYPRAVAFHEQRLFFAGTRLEPNTFWGSATDDFLNFRRGAFDGDSLSFTLAAQEGSAIQSMVSHEALIMFTQTEEWTATTTQQTPITPSNIFVRRQSRFGSEYRQAFIANNEVLFIQRGGRKLRQFSYSVQEAGGQSIDLSLLAEHLTRSGIKQVAFQQQPDPVLWVVTNDGDLLSATYESGQDVVAWSRHQTNGLVESVAVIYGSGGGDEVWLATNRAGVRSIERLFPSHHRALETGDDTGLIYLDAAVIKSGSAFTTIAGLNHLEGRSIQVRAGSIFYPALTVTSGAVTLPVSATWAVAGLGYTSLLQPSRIEVGMQDGTAQGRKFVCKRVSLNLYETTGMEYSDNPDNADSLWYQVPIPSEGYTGQVDINNAGIHSGSVSFSIRQSKPFACNVLGMVAKFDVLGD